jgi:deoxyadenosine/deoxycytidine kinase
MYIAIEGVIGVGKTTLARLLQPAFQAELLLEVFEENPFLSDFYADRERYAFQTQADYTFEKDALFAGINLRGDELEMYRRVHEALAEKIPLPDLVVYLRADTDVLMQRIALRDRPYERNMELAYINELNQAYDEFFIDNRQSESESNTPVLVIDTNQLDYVRNSESLKWVENRIRQALHLSPFQAELPFGISSQD